MISYKDITEAQNQIKPYINRRPLIFSSSLSIKLNSGIYFKPENLQLTGSFKIRGALNKILSLTAEEKKRGIITASSGNHALGVAYGAKLCGLKSIIVMPENAQKTKIESVKALGSEVFLYGETPVQRYEKVYKIQKEKGCTIVHSCDDPKVIAGQGTVGFEIIEESGDIDTVIVPLGAGALAAGIGCAVKNHNPEIRVIGVETEAIPRFTVSRKNKAPTEVPFNPTIADGLKMTRTFPELYQMAEKYVDDVINVSDKFILEACREIILNGKMLVEPSGAIGLAGILSGKINLKDNKKNIIVLSGGNIDADKLCEIIVS